MRAFSTIENRLLRCAIYTRKSTTHGLERPLNSLETQRSVCESYIRSQAHRNWVQVGGKYDDGGFSGGSLARPALNRLMADIEAGKVDVIVIYKVDRLSRSLPDFIRLMDVLDKHGASFVSVTQSFDTSDSMGRLILNILLTFAQFERELASERIKDRCAARIRKGLFPGGMTPIGYQVERDGKLVPDPERAKEIRRLYEDFPETSAAELGRRLEAINFKTYSFGCRSGSENRKQQFPACNILRILRNPLYAGYYKHNGELVKSQIEPLVSFGQWERVQEIMRIRGGHARDPEKNFLLGIIHDELGRRMTTHQASNPSRTLRYYVSEATGWARGHAIKKIYVRADELEGLVISTIQAFFADRAALRETVLSLGIYSKDVASRLLRGQKAARRISLMDKVQLREFVCSVVYRADVNRTHLRILLCNFEVSRFLAWDGAGLFRSATVRPKGAEKFRMLWAPANLICTRPQHALPVEPADAGERHPDEELVNVLKQASELREFMLGNRSKTLAQLARHKKMGAKHFARLVRLNYLAPDIQAAIVDGRQPSALTPTRLVFSSLPLDWEQQRRLFDFPSPVP